MSDDELAEFIAIHLVALEELRQEITDLDEELDRVSDEIRQWAMDHIKNEVA